jgi:hypothetical protein
MVDIFIDHKLSELPRLLPLNPLSPEILEEIRVALHSKKNRTYL